MGSLLKKGLNFQGRALQTLKLGEENLPFSFKFDNNECFARNILQLICFILHK